jgi:hypothetical protein
LKRGFLAAVLLLLPLHGGRAQGQQLVTDDAATAEHRACQVEVWHGEISSWLIPACSPLRNLEVALGFGAVSDGSSRVGEYVLGGKYVPVSIDLGGGVLGLGVGGGLGFAPVDRLTPGGVSGAFAYGIGSLGLAGERLALHANLGWHYEQDEHEHNGVVHQEGHHAVIWGVRGDGWLPFVAQRVAVIGELFGADRISPEFQVGLRSILVPDRLDVDVTWGGHTASGRRGSGWTLGLAWTAPPSS